MMRYENANRAGRRVEAVTPGDDARSLVTRGVYHRSEGSAAASAGFSPSSVPGLFAWYDFSTLALADGANIASIADLSGITGTAANGLAGSQPIFRANSNGKKVADFTQARNSRLTSPNVNTVLTTVTRFIAGVHKLGGANGEFDSCFNSSLGQPFWELGSDNASLTDGAQFAKASGATTTAKKATVATWANSGALNTLLVIRHTCDGTNAGHLLFTGGGAVALLANGLSNNPGNLGAPGFPILLGNRFDLTGTQAVDAFIGEVLYYSPQPTAAQVTAIEAYLTAKWT